MEVRRDEGNNALLSGPSKEGRCEGSGVDDSGECESLSFRYSGKYIFLLCFHTESARTDLARRTKGSGPRT